MRVAALSTWLLSAAALAAATDALADEYIPRPLNETVEALGLQEYVAELPPLEKRDISTRCQAAVRQTLASPSIPRTCSANA